MRERETAAGNVSRHSTPKPDCTQKKKCLAITVYNFFSRKKVGTNAYPNTMIAHLFSLSLIVGLVKCNGAQEFPSIKACRCPNIFQSESPQALQVCLYDTNPNIVLLELQNVVVMSSPQDQVTVLVVNEENVTCRERYCPVQVSVEYDNDHQNHESISSSLTRDNGNDWLDFGLNGTAILQELLANETAVTRQVAFAIAVSDTNAACTSVGAEPKHQEEDVYVAKGVGLVVFVLVSIIIVCCYYGTKSRGAQTTNDIPV